MRIGIDLTGLWRRQTGIFRYARCISQALLARDDDIAYTLFYRRGEAPPAFALGPRDRLIEAPRQRVARPPKSGGSGPHVRLGVSRHSSLVQTPLRQERLVMNLWFPLARRRLGLDAIHYPAFPAPLFQQNGMVASIHDVTALRYPETMTFVGRHYWRPLLTHAARVARPVLTGSHSTRADVIALAGAQPARVVVTPYAADAAFAQQPTPDVLAAIRVRYRLPERFVLAVGTLEPRKNLGTLFAALQRLRRALADPPTLVVVGREGWGPAAVEQLRSLGDAVRFTGHIDDEALIALYHLAAVFVYPSLYEGFGFPILEAFAAGCPVVTTAVSSLPELAGDAALLVEPLDATALAEAIARLWRDDALAGRLRAAGRARARQFTWERCAELTAAAYHMAR